MTSGAWGCSGSKESQAWSPDSRDQRVCEAVITGPSPTRSTECGSPNPAAVVLPLGAPAGCSAWASRPHPAPDHAPSGTQEAEYHVSQEGVLLRTKGAPVSDV